MTAVKGSKQYHMKVVAYRPWVRWLLIFTGVAVIVGAVFSSFLTGQIVGLEQQAEAVAERDRLRIELDVTAREAAQYRQSVANLKLGAQVDRKASEGVRGEVMQLKERIAELEADISFYRDLMSPADNKQGLTIGSLNVISTGAPRHYEYKLVMQQLAARHKVLQGVLVFNIIGRQGETQRTLALKDVSESVNSDDIKLRFKYFQSLQGRLILPEGFEPERIELVARSSGKDSVTVEKKFGWLVQES
jgi:hypothetical protein